jgi:peptidoglycan hydrolase-like protein with peptidoglycan-binding domain
MPAILNEGAFVDNQKDIADWDEEHELKKLGIAYAEAAAEYLQLEKKEKTVTVTFPELAYGKKNDDNVRVLQALLKGFGFRVNPTGNYGNSTVEAVKAAQEAFGLPVTGKCDHNTWNALLLVK